MRLKLPGGVADALGMRSGGWPWPRRLAVSSLICVVLSMSSSPASIAEVASDGAPVAPVIEGDPGTGVPPFPFVIPRTRERLTATIRWSDVATGYWAKTAIDFVGAARDWMRDYPANGDGSYPFHPTVLETRKLFARAMVRAFAPDATPNPMIHFADLPDDAPFYPFANIAVDRGWMSSKQGNFFPGDPVPMSLVHRSIVYALGLKTDADGLDRIHTQNGVTFDTRQNFGSTLIGMRLGLRYNHSDESLDVNFDTPLPRAEVAWSLYRAKTLPSYAISSMSGYATIQLPTMGAKMLHMVQWGIEYVGYPYVWGGEWYTRTGSGYCCGFQPIGGFDCSGLTWWIMKHAAGGWDNQPPRPYVGWDLPQRASGEMATVGNIDWGHLVVGDLMFYDGDGDGTVDHVDTYIGNGWSLDSSGTPAGVTIMWVGSGWYHDHFVHARDIVG